MRLFFMTIQFLTRIPIPFFDTKELLPKQEFAKGIIFYPIIGFLVGSICYLAYWIGSLWGCAPLSAFFAVFANIFVTGAFHLDGLADTCDGIFSSRSKKRMLEIMHDSRLGTNGAAAMLFDILLRILLLSMLWGPYAFFGIVLAPVAGKMVTPILMHTVYARDEDGLGNLYIGRASGVRLCFTVLLGIFLLTLCMGLSGVMAALLILLFAFLFRWYLEKTIGGMTGDTLGAGSELSELVFLFVLTFLMRRNLM